MYAILAAMVLGSWPTLPPEAYWPELPPIKDDSPAHETGILLPPIIIESVPTKSEKLTRLPGPRHRVRGCSCLMCLGNHLVNSHDMSMAQLYKFNRHQWQLLHDNCHNAEGFQGHKSSGSPVYSPRPRLFRRRR